MESENSSVFGENEFCPADSANRFRSHAPVDTQALFSGLILLLPALLASQVQRFRTQHSSTDRAGQPLRRTPKSAGSAPLTKAQER